MRGAPVEARDARDGRPVVHVHLKVVPGASQAGLVGAYGDRFKVRVTAAAESGKANKAVCALLASALGVPAQAISLVRGASHPLKTVEIRGLAATTVTTRLYGDNP